MKIDMDYHRRNALYYLNAAKRAADKGSVYNVKDFLRNSKLYAGNYSEDLLNEIRTKESDITKTAYEKGIPFRLKGVKEVIQNNHLMDDNLKPLLILNAYGWLNETRKYASKIKKDISERTKKLEEELNSLGLQKYLRSN